MANLKFNDAVKFQQMVDDYFKECDNNNKPYTISGLAYALGTSRETILDYKNMLFAEETVKREDVKRISDSIKAAKLRCERYAEEYLFTGRNQAGCIFNLKNNYKWKDQQEIINKTSTIEDLSEEDVQKLKEKYGYTIESDATK